MKKMFKMLFWTLLLLTLSFVHVGSNEASAKEFKDVPQTHPNYTAIQEMQKAGFISGYPDGNFRPSEPISRKHVAVLLDKALKFPKPATTKVVFTDVPKNHAYYAPIMKLYNQGIVSGANGKFNSEASVTRIQMAKMLDLAFEFNMTEHAGFYDLIVTHWGYVHANALFSNGVTKGDNGYFKPNDKVTRAHYAEFLNRAIVAHAAQPNIARMNKDGALDKLNRLTSSVERIFLLSQENNQTFNQVRPEYLQYATARYVDEVIAKVYKQELDYLQYVNNPLYAEVQLRFDFSQPSLDVLHVETIQFRNITDDTGGFVHAAFTKEAGKWRISDYDVDFPGTNNFEMTVEEAKFAIEEEYKRHGFKNVQVQYISKKQVTSEDYSSHEKYQYFQYKFTVDSNIGHDDITFHADSGLWR